MQIPRSSLQIRVRSEITESSLADCDGAVRLRVRDSACARVRHLATFGRFGTVLVHCTVVPSGEEAGDASRASFYCSPAAVSAFYLLLTAEPAAGCSAPCVAL